MRVRGHRRCECGAEWSVDFSGPEDSIGVAIAKSSLAAERCDACREREENEAREAEAVAGRAQRIAQRVNAAGLPAAWRTLTFDELEEKPGQARAVEAGRAWAAGQLGGLVLHGAVGRGKTVIAAASAVTRCAVGPVRWLGVAGLLMDLRMPFDAPEYVRAQRKLDAGTSALVLDDLDKLKPTEHQLQPLYVAINGWLEARLPLLVTLNRNLGAFDDWAGVTFGPALASRLAGYCEVVEVTGKDWRQE